MPQRATREQRIARHVAQARACSCREIPEGIKTDVEKRLRARKR